MSVSFASLFSVHWICTWDRKCWVMWSLHVSRLEEELPDFSISWNLDLHSEVSLVGGFWDLGLDQDWKASVVSRHPTCVSPAASIQCTQPHSQSGICRGPSLRHVPVPCPCAPQGKNPACYLPGDPARCTVVLLPVPAVLELAGWPWL